MLNADLVRATRRGGELKLQKLTGKVRVRAVEIAEQYLEAAQAHLGRSREELHAALAEVPTESKEKKLADGLAKLLEDACEFAAETNIEPRELRSEVFLEASRVRRGLAVGIAFERDQILQTIAERHEIDPGAVEGGLFADLRAAHLFQSFRYPLTPESLVNRYDISSRQAVLLKAVRVVANVHCKDPTAYRDLFRQLKFRRLLYRIEKRAEGGYRIEIDGPFSLFDSVTKYGLQLALVLPALERVDTLELVAELRWGKKRDRLEWHWSTKRKGQSDSEALAEAPLPDELAALEKGWERLKSGWKLSPSAELLDLPGVGLCVPDAVFEHPEHGRIYLELMGFWSRDAVWKRVELVEAGLPYRVVFAVSSRLRVSQDVLPPDTPGALVVYKGTLSAKAVLAALERVGPE